MKVSQGTYLQDRTVEYFETDVESEDFKLVLVYGRDNFTSKWVWKPVAKSFGTMAGGCFWTEKQEALDEGIVIVEKQQIKLNEDKIRWEKEYQAR